MRIIDLNLIETKEQIEKFVNEEVVMRRKGNIRENTVLQTVITVCENILL